MIRRRIGDRPGGCSGGGPPSGGGGGTGRVTGWSQLTATSSP
jgi:hypothetical protein